MRYSGGKGTKVVHWFKCWHEYYSAMQGGKKLFDIRLDDREDGFQVGDYVVQCDYFPTQEMLSGGAAVFQVEYILRYDPRLAAIGWRGIGEGYVVMGLGRLTGHIADEIVRRGDPRGEITLPEISIYS